MEKDKEKDKDKDKSSEALTSGIGTETTFLNLKAIELKDVRKEVALLLVDDEMVVAAFKTVRDQVIFTNKRIMVINVQNLLGKKKSYYSYPYSKVQFYAIETADVFDIDSELILLFSNGTRLQFDFRASVDIRKISQMISNYIL